MILTVRRVATLLFRDGKPGAEKRHPEILYGPADDGGRLRG